MYRYLVMRKEGLINGPAHSTINRSYFPVLVEFPYPAYPELAVRNAFEQRGFDSYQPRDKHYLVFEVNDAHEVSFVPKRDYDVVVKEF